MARQYGINITLNVNTTGINSIMKMFTTTRWLANNTQYNIMVSQQHYGLTCHWRFTHGWLVRIAATLVTAGISHTPLNISVTLPLALAEHYRATVNIGIGYGSAIGVYWLAEGQYWFTLVIIYCLPAEHIAISSIINTLVWLVGWLMSIMFVQYWLH